MKVKHSRVQHGVGQGSFHSATVEFEAVSGTHRFDYIYDCGAMVAFGREAPGLKHALHRLSLEQREAGGGRAVLDLLILSHFDADHMNGAKKLVERYSVDRIVLPYLGIEELALVIASQAHAFDERTIEQLHGLANNANTFWGHPVTMVKIGSRNTEDGTFQPRAAEGTEQPSTQEFPRRVPVILQSTGTAPGTVMLDNDNLIAGPSVAGVADAWKLRFWNRGLDPVLGGLIIEALAHIRFPVAALSDQNNGARDIIAWLNVKPPKGRAKKGHGTTKASGPSGNRDLAVAAYREAILKYKPTWLSETNGDLLANFLSLGLYSGPAFNADVSTIRCRTIHDDFHYFCKYYPSLPPRERLLPGWIGTGDAPLGEPAIWQDFKAHYTVELPQTQTVVMPHHGAAPVASTRFYNAGLNHRQGVNSVISYGTRNSHGHPHPSVLAGITYMDGRLLLVNEQTRLGFQEIYLFEHP